MRLAQIEKWIAATNLARKDQAIPRRAMTARSIRRKAPERTVIDREFRRIAEKNLRRDRELLEKLAKI